MFAFLQSTVIFALSIAALVGSVWAIIDAAKYSDAAYHAAGKQSKTIWLLILGAATLIAFISVPPPIGRGSGIVGFLGIISIAAVLVYFVEVRVKVAPHHRPGGSGGPKRGTW